ncbi:MAG: hydantoinase B/oxoprolinase family protein [Thermoplasmata archaeon]
MSAPWELVGKATEFVAEEMGIALKRSALSPNIRERMDHSCVVLTPEGNIVAQAEHIPVHLGSFRVGAETLLRWLEEQSVELRPGDMIAVNDPYISGTHLNDLLILAPVFVDGRSIAYVASKAHIVDVGGPSPGSLNPEARTLYAEGMVLPPTKLVERDTVRPELTRILAANFKDAATALGDVNAEVAANRMGISRIRQLAERFGVRSVRAGWLESIAHTRKVAQRELARIRPGSYRAVDYLEWGRELVPIHLRLTVSRSTVTADFTGSHPAIPAPLNAVLGVTYSATAFAIRSMIRAAIATNHGFYDCVRVVAPEGSIVNPRSPAPVSGGNVETTQRVADVTFLALSQALGDDVPAASSGTMMNVMLGGDRPSGGLWAYYETIGGGSGARAGEDGVSAIHTNMTNTLNTPVEVAEREYPVFYTRYQVRSGSGGAGRWKGGDGIVRGFQVCSPSTLAVISDRFRRGPWGLKGGRPGAVGRVSISRGGRRVSMPSKFVTQLAPGDEVTVETPGGGGFGPPRRKRGVGRPRGSRT